MSYKNCTSCGSKSHYTQQCPKPNYPHTGHHQPPPCTPTHCDPCKPQVVCDAVNDVTAAPARPLLVGSPQFFTQCGDPASGWFITITDPVTGQEKTVYTDPSKVQTIPQPIMLNQQGRVTAYTTGKYVVTLFEPDNCGNLGKAVERTVTQGGDFEGDFPLNPSPMLECIDDSCSVRVYNNEGCIYPKGLTSPKVLAIQGAVGAGQVAGKWSEVNAYFQCLNAPCPEGIQVYGDTNKQIYELLPEGDCTVDPETDDGTNWQLCATCLLSAKVETITATTIPQATFVQMPFETVKWDDSSYIDALSPDEFVMPADGRYEFNVTLGAGSGATSMLSHESRLAYSVNGSLTPNDGFNVLIERETIDQLNNPVYQQADPGMTASIILELSKGDTVAFFGFFDWFSASVTFPAIDNIYPATAQVKRIC